MDPTSDVSSMLDSVIFWWPLEDPDKPTLPYLLGFSVQIRRHTPAPANATAEELESLGHEERPRLRAQYLRSVTQSEAVVANSPVDGIPSAQDGTAQLVIASPIAIGPARGAQIVACTVTPHDGKPFTAVAKIYDPLYYNYLSRLGHYPEDCVANADADYTVETCTYEFLERTGQTGLYAPEYYGSWTFTLPIVSKGVSTKRPIRLILIEHLVGSSIQGSRIQNNPDTDPDSFHYPEEYRLEILARAMDGYVRQRKTGIMQLDFTGRHIMPVADKDPAVQSERICGLTPPRIVLIDYTKTWKNPFITEIADESQPENPAYEFSRNWLWHEIPGWVPSSWHDGQAQQQWLLRRFCGPGQEELYSPVPEWIDELVPACHYYVDQENFDLSDPPPPPSTRPAASSELSTGGMGVGCKTNPCESSGSLE